jgi:hypothetical protein
VTRVAKRKRARKRGTGPTIVILLVTSGIVGVALWAIWQATLQNESTVATPEATAAPRPREEIRPSDRERLDDVLRQTDEQGKGGGSAN